MALGVFSLMLILWHIVVSGGDLVQGLVAREVLYYLVMSSVPYLMSEDLRFL